LKKKTKEWSKRPSIDFFFRHLIQNGWENQLTKNGHGLEATVTPAPPTFMSLLNDREGIIKGPLPH
jgi:hypothetical protein